jgi:hypothetical protein
MKKMLKNISSTTVFAGSVLLIVLIVGMIIISMYDVKESTIQLNKDVAFETDRTILKMRKDSLLKILTNWKNEDSSVFKKIDSSDSDWISLKYEKSYQRGIMNIILGDEEVYKKADNIMVFDTVNKQIRFKVEADTAKVYVRLITQYYSLPEKTKTKSRKK